MTTDTLRRGYHLFSDNSGGWVIFGPHDQWVRLHTDPDKVAALATALRDTAQGRPVDFVALGVAELLQALKDADMIGPDAPPVPVPAQGQIWLRGDGALADALTALLPALGARLQHWPDPRAIPETAAPTDLLLDIAPWQPSQRWLALDLACRERQLAWYGCHQEGRRVFAGPLLRADAPMRYADVMERRLACADHVDEWLAYLDYVETSGVDATPPALVPAAVARLAGAIAAELIDFLHGAPAVPLLWQSSLDVDASAWQRHPILPIPRDLAT